MALSTTVLHILCQPRYLDPTSDSVDGGEDYNQLLAKMTSYPGRIPVEKLKLLTAFGFFCAAAPTNIVLKKKEDSSKTRIGGITAAGAGLGLGMYLTGVGACGYIFTC